MFSSARSLLRNPAYTTAAVSALALGTTAVALALAFSNAFFFRPMPFVDDHELVGISMTHAAATGEVVDFAVSPRDYLALVERNRTLQGAAAINSQAYTIVTGDAPVSVRGARVSATMWGVLGTTPVAGRTFTEEEDRSGARVVVISEGFQQRLFAGEPAAAVGRALTIDGTTMTVIGVMPRGFRPRMNPGDVWIPLGVTAGAANLSSSRQLQMVGRLRPGVTLTQARDDFTRMARALETERPETNREWGVSVKGLRAKIGDSARVVSATLLAAVVFLLLLTCANAANLAIARVTRARMDIATRAALGASAGAIGRQYVFEALLISVAGGVAGLALAAVILPMAMRLLTSDNPMLSLVSFDWRVIAGAGVATVAAAAIASAFPAAVAVRLVQRSSLAESTRRSGGQPRDVRVRRVLMAVQVGAAVVLLIGAAGALLALRTALSADLGYAPGSVAYASVRLPAARYPDQPSRLVFAAAVLDRLAAAPGVEQAGVTTSEFLRDNSVVGTFSIENDPLERGAQMTAELRRVTAGFFATLGVGVIEGRTFTAADRDSAPPVAIVNQAFVRQYLGGESPLGVRIRRGTLPWTTVVGVVPDFRDGGQGEPAGAAVYLHYPQSAAPMIAFVARGSVAPDALARVIGDVVRTVDPGQPVDRAMALPQMLSESLGEERFRTLVLGGLALLAALVAAVGIYGVTAYVADASRRDIAIRVALGARSGIIVGQFVREVMRWIAGGLAGGVAACWLIATRASPAVSELVAARPLVYLSAGMLLAAIGTLAAMVPALRVSRAAPVTVLRGE